MADATQTTDPMSRAWPSFDVTEAPPRIRAAARWFVDAQLVATPGSPTYRAEASVDWREDGDVRYLEHDAIRYYPTDSHPPKASGEGVLLIVLGLCLLVIAAVSERWVAVIGVVMIGLGVQVRRVAGRRAAQIFVHQEGFYVADDAVLIHGARPSASGREPTCTDSSCGDRAPTAARRSLRWNTGRSMEPSTNIPS